MQIGAVSHVNISPCYPYDVAVTSSTRVLVYDKSTAQVRRQFTRFKDKAYSGTFRGDGKLLVAGGEDGVVQVGRLNHGWSGRLLMSSCCSCDLGLG